MLFYFLLTQFISRLYYLGDKSKISYRLFKITVINPI
nr:MAG TPA: hypothetical protein [Caudoviricetes sp.]